MTNKREVKINGGRGVEIFVKFNKSVEGAGFKINGGVGISKYPLILVTNEKRDVNV